MTDRSVIAYHVAVPPRDVGPLPLPPDSASFAEKLAFYRSQHRTRGNRSAHLIGVPVIVFGLPLVAVKPRVGVVMFVGGWLVLIGAHRFIEGNMPSTHRGWLTYQLTGVVDVCETYGQMLARRAERRAARRGSAASRLAA